MTNNTNYQKIVLECSVCKTKFELWIATTNWFSPEFGDYLKENFSRFCPICKALEELEKRDK